MALVLVTGASTGLGLATATELIHGGHDVVLHARNPSRLEGLDVSEQVRGVVLGDLAHPREVRAVAEHASEFGRFDAVIHNAGTMDSADAVAVNVLAPYRLTVSMPLPDRAIFLSSSMHLSGRPQVGPVLAGHGGNYSDSKLLVTALALALRLKVDSLLTSGTSRGSG